MGDRKAGKRGLKQQRASATPAPISMRAVRQVWSRVTDGKPWPDGWKVRWGTVERLDGEIEVLESTDVARFFPATKTILIDFTHTNRYRNVVGALIHELAHLYAPDLDHDATFRKIVQRFRVKAGLSRSKRPTKSM